MRLRIALFSLTLLTPAIGYAQPPSVPATLEQSPSPVFKPGDIKIQNLSAYSSGREYGSTYEPTHTLPSLGPFTPQIYTYKTTRNRGFGDEVKIHHDFRLLYDLGGGKGVGVVGNGIGGIIHF